MKKTINLPLISSLKCTEKNNSPTKQLPINLYRHNTERHRATVTAAYDRLNILVLGSHNDLLVNLYDLQLPLQTLPLGRCVRPNERDLSVHEPETVTLLLIPHDGYIPFAWSKWEVITRLYRVVLCSNRSQQHLLIFRAQLDAIACILPHQLTNPVHRLPNQWFIFKAQHFVTVSKPCQICGTSAQHSANKNLSFLNIAYGNANFAIFPFAYK